MQYISRESLMLPLSVLKMSRLNLNIFAQVGVELRSIWSNYRSFSFWKSDNASSAPHYSLLDTSFDVCNKMKCLMTKNIKCWIRLGSGSWYLLYFNVVLSENLNIHFKSFVFMFLFPVYVSLCDREILKCANRVKYCSEGCHHESCLFYQELNVK